MAADPETGERGARQVTNVIVGEGSKDLVEIDIDGETITATDGHPFWVASDFEWTDAEDLEVGDELLLADGSTVAVDAVHEYTVEAVVYNLTVDDVHTYFVTTGAAAVLVHNQTCYELADRYPPNRASWVRPKRASWSPEQ